MRIVKAIRLEDLSLELRLIEEKVSEASINSLSLDRMVLVAKSFCPVDTGALSASIRSERNGPLSSSLISGGVDYLNPKTGRPVDYAQYVHEGTSRVPARPFLLQAILSERTNLANEIIERSGGLLS